VPRGGGGGEIFAQVGKTALRDLVHALAVHPSVIGVVMRVGLRERGRHQIGRARGHHAPAPPRIAQLTMSTASLGPSIV
jgi:hypothetical protein